MEDVQSQFDNREVPIDHVGVTKIRCPIMLRDRERGTQHTVAEVTMSVDLPKEFRGTHMSRFVEIMGKYRHNITADSLTDIVREIQDRLHAAKAHISVRFPYFIEKRAPVTGATALTDYEGGFEVTANGDDIDFMTIVEVPVTSLCPCSKAVSDYGAHNQRGLITIRVRPRHKGNDDFEMIWLEELIELAEKCGSSPIFPLLKREDERHVTMYAYDHPVFVEDMVRNAAVLLRADERIIWYEVRAENAESIHNHNAFAVTSWWREGFGPLVGR